MMMVASRTSGMRHPRQISASWPQVEDDETSVFQDAAVCRAKVAMEPGVVLEPPEGWPREDDEARSTRPQSLKLSDGGRVIDRRTPVLPVLFEERNAMTTGNDLVGRPLLLIYEDEAALLWDQGY